MVGLSLVRGLASVACTAFIPGLKSPRVKSSQKEAAFPLKVQGLRQTEASGLKPACGSIPPSEGKGRSALGIRSL